MKIQHLILTWMVIWLVANWAKAQPPEALTLETAYSLLDQRYPLVGDTALIHEMEAIELALNKRGGLPNIRLLSESRLQSTSTRLESDNPMFPLEINQPLVNMKAYLEAEYLWLDGGQQKARESIIRLEKGVEREELAVQRFALRKIVNHLFLRIHTLRAQQQLLLLSLADLQLRYEQLLVAVKQGTVLASEPIKVKVKLLELEAASDNLSFQEAGARQSLADWLGIDLPEDVVLVFPNLSPSSIREGIHRPELVLYRHQKDLVFAQAERIDSQWKPKLRLFAQVGLGYPNPLNLLDNQVAPFGLIGAGFSWNLNDWGKSKMQKELLSLKAKRIDLAAESFLFQLEKKSAAYRADLAKIDQQISRQENILSLQQELLGQLSSQLEEGVITATDYLLQMNAELAVRREIALLQAERQAVALNYWNERAAF